MMAKMGANQHNHVSMKSFVAYLDQAHTSIRLLSGIVAMGWGNHGYQSY
jgi:hypothetical protein